MQALIIHNPRSGFGSDAIFEFERALLREGDECVVRVLDDRFAAQEALRDAESYDVVVLSGGDATVTSLLHALVGRDVTSCVFPSGEENLIVVNVGNAPEPSALARACRIGKTAMLDLATVSWESPQGQRTRGFGTMTGVGYNPQLLHSSLTEPGTMGSAFLFASALQDMRPRAVDMVVTVDGQDHPVHGISCLVANDAMLPGGVPVVPSSRMDDGLLEVIVLETPTNPEERPRHGLTDSKGNRIGRPTLRTMRGRSVSVRLGEPLALTVDGHDVGDIVGGFSAQVIPSAVRVIVDTMSPYCPKGDSAPRFSGTDEIAYPEG